MEPTQRKNNPMNNNLTIKEKHLYCTRGGDVVYAYKEDMVVDFVDFDTYAVNEDGTYVSWGESARQLDLISEIPTPPIDFSRIGEVEEDGSIAIFSIPSWCHKERICNIMLDRDRRETGRILSTAIAEWKPAPTTITIGNKTYRKTPELMAMLEELEVKE